MRLGNAWMQLELDEGSALDIGSLTINGVEIAPGKAVPDDGDARILHAVEGFLFTCGPDHIRHPEPVEDESGRRYPLHGSLSGNPATITADTVVDGVRIIATTTRVAMAQGGLADLHRQWRFETASGALTLEDRLVNVGTTAFPPMYMYHMNIGAHLFDDATMLTGPHFDNGSTGWRFGQGETIVTCVEAVTEQGRANLGCGPIASIGRTLHVWFDPSTLPHLQMWRNQSGACNVLGIEPVSHPAKGRRGLHRANAMVPLEPGAATTYRLGFVFR
jgi:hypothetical protein